ncbi:MAG: hypothetical protein RR100_12335 [Comamonas sp.]
MGFNEPGPALPGFFTLASLDDSLMKQGLFSWPLQMSTAVMKDIAAQHALPIIRANSIQRTFGD